MSKYHLDQHISLQIKEDKHIMHQHIFLLALDEELDQRNPRRKGEKSTQSSNLGEMTLNPK